MVSKRGGRLHIKFYAYGQEVGLSTPAKTRKEAKEIEEAIKRACRIGDASWLDPMSMEVCGRLFRNRGWAMLPGLADPMDKPVGELTIWKAVEACLKHPEVRNSANRERHEQSFLHVVRYFGKDCRIQDLWIPEIKEYFALRVSEGAAASTISKERSALSLMFKCLIEYQMVDRNPVREVKGPSDPARREVYISWKDFEKVSALLPPWVRPITWTLYFTGMRRGEVMNLTWDNIDLNARVIRLTEDQTKERKRKRVPISQRLLPILVEVGHVRLMSKKVFHIRGREPSEDSLRKPWVVAVKAAGLDPTPTIHDIRHVWKTNAMRSGMDYEIREAIVGHRTGKTMAERYGRISDEDLVKAIDAVTFDHGKTEILIATTTRIHKNHEQNPNKTDESKKSGQVAATTMT